MAPVAGKTCPNHPLAAFFREIGARWPRSGFGYAASLVRKSCTAHLGHIFALTA